MSINLELLKKQIQNNTKNSNLEQFNNLICIYLGVEPKEYFSKMRDESGNLVKDEKGNVMREPVSSGYTYTFSEVGTSKIIKIVLPKKINLQLLGLYVLNGYGYDIRQSSMIFIQEEGKIYNYEQK